MACAGETIRLILDMACAGETVPLMLSMTCAGETVPQCHVWRALVRLFL